MAVMQSWIQCAFPFGLLDFQFGMRNKVPDHRLKCFRMRCDVLRIHRRDDTACVCHFGLGVFALRSSRRKRSLLCLADPRVKQTSTSLAYSRPPYIDHVFESFRIRVFERSQLSLRPLVGLVSLAHGFFDSDLTIRGWLRLVAPPSMITYKSLVR